MARCAKSQQDYEQEMVQTALSSILQTGEELAADAEKVKGYDFNLGVDYHRLLSSYRTTGFQATNFGLALAEINKMIDCKLLEMEEAERKKPNTNPCGRPRSNCTIFLSYTSNMISSGIREIIRYLVEHNMVDCIVTTAGGIEEDLIKCLGAAYLGRFEDIGKELRGKTINRIGNLLVPNNHYIKFQQWLCPIFDRMLEEQKDENVNWTPSQIIARLGKEINNPESVYYWAQKNKIPVFCPALTDGALGDALFFHSFRNPGLRVDLIEDIRRMSLQALCAVNSGMIILGGGLAKHHTCNANAMRNGADFSVYVNTGMEYDGSDAGARPDEAVSWGKIKTTATPVKIYGEATLIFPLLVAETFARRKEDFQKMTYLP